METDGEQNQQGAPANGSAASGAVSRPSAMNSMTLYERQAVQALQALQRQPNAAQYFQQLMLQQQINSAQLQSLAAVQQATLAGRQPSASSSSSSAPTSSPTATTSGTTTSNRPMGASASSAISQSVLLSGGPGGQGQMYLRVNRSLRAPISSQLIFMPGNAATAVATATVNQQQQQQQQDGPSASSSNNQPDSEQVQNLAIRGVSSSKTVKTEAPERNDAGVQAHSQATPTKPAPPHIKIPTYPQPTNLKAPPTSSIPLSQLLLHGSRTLTAGTAAAPTFVLASNAASQAQRYPVGTATIKPAINAQTLVVQPLQKSSLGGEKPSSGPVPIQPKTLQGLRLPLQLPSRNPPPILPAASPALSSAQAPPPPHVPVQIVGARQSSQALALARSSSTSCSQEGGAVLTMVASIASRDARKPLQSPQDAPPSTQVSQVHPQTNQSRALASGPAHSPPPSLSRSSLSLPLVTDEQRGASTTNGDAAGGVATQGKQTSVSQKRKSDPSSAHDEDGPSPPRLHPIRDQTSALKGNHLNTGSVAPPPPSSSMLCVSRGVGNKAPPPQAVVKPHVLTHLIEGFVIQEGPEPFPVCGPMKDSADEEMASESPDTNQSENVITATVLKCEYCKNFAPATQFRGTKRFCSMTCAKRYNVSFRQRQGRHRLSTSDGEEGGGAKRKATHRGGSDTASVKVAVRRSSVKCHSESSHSDEESSAEDDEDDPVSLSPASSSASCHQPALHPPLPPPLPPSLPMENSAHAVVPATPAQWSVEEVSQFISSLQGCEDLASQFLSQEIDGQALLLLKEEHLMSTMNIKLGPALKICAHINTLRD
ncbi:polyhomeotic-like protein 1 isoform X2 [Gouania willdenowi]|uniref:polyhomeotic-like protein 1 isoform X2 n=1 Tax=Gouania willdenowi TaxID=441366 RepID=UPI0010555A32|nr:polyhomeotic-like protein 1 isoform X2 [Gouania willdenowi]